jgi:hypothetical protein
MAGAQPSLTQIPLSEQTDPPLLLPLPSPSVTNTLVGVASSTFPPIMYIYASKSLVLQFRFKLYSYIFVCGTGV